MKSKEKKRWKLKNSEEKSTSRDESVRKCWHVVYKDSRFEKSNGLEQMTEFLIFHMVFAKMIDFCQFELTN